MSITPLWKSDDLDTIYQHADERMKLRSGQLHFFRTIAESVGVQGPTGGVVIGAAILAGISGGGTSLVQLIAAPLAIVSPADPPPITATSYFSMSPLSSPNSLPSL